MVKVPKVTVPVEVEMVVDTPDADAEETTDDLPNPICAYCRKPAGPDLGPILAHEVLDPGHALCIQARYMADANADLEAKLKNGSKAYQGLKSMLAREQDGRAEDRAAAAPKSACDKARVTMAKAEDLWEEAEVRTELAGDLFAEARDGYEECRRKEAARHTAIANSLRVRKAGGSLIEYRSKSTLKIGLPAGGIGMVALLALAWFLGYCEPIREPDPITNTVEVKVAVPWPEPVVRFHIHRNESRKALTAFLVNNRGQLFPDQAVAFADAIGGDNKIMVFRVKADGTLAFIRYDRPGDDD